MPCKNEHHMHAWSKSGNLTIERCEKICGFCGNHFKHAWFLRRHVSNVHCKEYPDLKVVEGWSASPSGNRKVAGGKHAKGHVRKDSTASTSSFGSYQEMPVLPSIEGADGVLNQQTFAESFNVPELPLPMPGLSMPEMPMSEVPVPEMPLLNNNNNNNFNLAPAPALGIDAFNDMFTLSLPANPSFGENWVTPQTIRTTGGHIVGIAPAPERHHVARVLADGINAVVSGIVAGGGLMEEEVLYVLETFTGMFQCGVGTRGNY